MPSVHLGAGEQELLHLRTHVKRIIGPIVLGLVLFALAFIAHVALVPMAPADWQMAAMIAIWAVAGLLLIPLVVLPWMRWLSTTYTLTDRRIVTRAGLLTRRGHDLPLRSVSNVSTERGVTDRLFGCGTLVLETSADQPLRLDDIPDVERVNVLMSELIAGAGAAGYGTMQAPRLANGDGGYPSDPYGRGGRA